MQQRPSSSEGCESGSSSSIPEGDAHLVVLILSGQSVFDVLDGEEMRRARTRANPYEMIRGVFFLNRFAGIPPPPNPKQCAVVDVSFWASTLPSVCNWGVLFCLALLQGSNEDG